MMFSDNPNSRNQVVVRELTEILKKHEDLHLDKFIFASPTKVHTFVNLNLLEPTAVVVKGKKNWYKLTDKSKDMFRTLYKKHFDKDLK